jgi:hypothetical protein
MDKNFNIQEDKNQFQQEQNDLLKVVLSERYFKPWSLSPFNKTISSVPAGHLEIYITSQCNQQCEYCYLVNNPAIYPKEFLNKNVILENLRALYQWIWENEFNIPQVEFFTGEIWHSNYGFEVLDITLEYLQKGMRFQQILIPSNCSFVRDKKTLEKIQYYINNFAQIGVPLAFSISVDGKIVDAQVRPGSQENIYTDEFYDTLFEFAKFNRFGFHPMLAACDVHLWIENHKWWKSQIKKYDLDMGDVMILEVRNGDWTPEAIEEFCKFEKYLIDDLVECNLGDIGRACEECFGINQTYLDKHGYSLSGVEQRSYMPHHLAEVDEFLGCTIQNVMTVRLGDLAICPCHRTAYNKNLFGWFIKNDEGKICDIKANNPQLAIRTLLVNNVTATLGCDACIYNRYCMTPCCGQQMEKYHDMFRIDPIVCKFLKTKHKFLISYYNEIGFLDWIKNNITPYHVFYPKAENLLKFYEDVKEEELNEELDKRR